MEEENVFDLKAELEKETEYKEPVTTTEEPTETTPNQQTADFWGNENDFIEIPPEPTVTEPKTEEKPPLKITDKAKWASARTAAGMLNLTYKLIFPPIVNYKFKKRFAAGEIEKVEPLIDKPIADLKGEELRLRTKFDKWLEKRDKQIAEIPLQEEEKKDLEEAFFSYFDIKEKTMPPEWFLYTALINTTGKRAVDVFTN